ncbi:MAG: PEP-CTERM sorting domain-containing protein [Planctomycetes bacterium]|nr:PEP-CTERM sorting domain-containing protein [Planctomycetota bacterium]
MRMEVLGSGWHVQTSRRETILWTQTVPEPSTLWMVAMSSAGLWRRRKR